jgi:hypothetical protein
MQVQHRRQVQPVATRLDVEPAPAKAGVMSQTHTLFGNICSNCRLSTLGDTAIACLLSVL